VDSRVNKKHKRKRKWPFWVGGILLAIILIIGGYIYYVWDKVGDTIATMHDPLERDDQMELSSLFKDNDTVNILLLGVDARDGDKGRSDTMILMSLNPRTNAMAMLSIPRDTYVDIPGRGMDKINHAYAYGDVALSVQTVENTFNLPVHFYARVNMEGFQQGIDAIDGVTIHNTQEFSQDGANFTKGNINLDGEDALKYIRMRKNDPRGDMGRNERQRDVLTAAINKGASFSNITKVGDILNILGSNVKTNLDKDHMQTLLSDYRGTRKNIKTIEISGDGQMINGVWYYVVPDSEFNRITTEIKDHMEAK
jgi:LCP family protein required for cell wall assembly